MSKSIHRTHRRRAKALHSGTMSPNGAGRPSDKPARRDTPDRHGLLDRILDTPHLEQVVPRLQPELLHRVIQSCGLEDSVELVALTTPDQLARIFDLDLWRAAQPGLDEQFDADRFGVWLEVLVESGATVAAQKLAGMDVDLVSRRACTTRCASTISRRSRPIRRRMERKRLRFSPSTMESPAT